MEREPPESWPSSPPTCDFPMHTLNHGAEQPGAQTWDPGAWPGAEEPSLSLETHIPSQKTEKQAAALRAEGVHCGLCLRLEGAPG